MTQKLVLFDLDNTLVDRAGAFRRWVEGFAAANSLPSCAVDWFVKADEGGYKPKRELFAEARHLFGLPETVDELWDIYIRAMPGLVRAEATTLDALLELRRCQWRIGIVTNGLPETQLEKIRAAGLLSYIDGYCISSEVGYSKPGTDIFRIAAQRCGLLLDDGGWMVGDNAGFDVAGGSAAGLKTIWISNGQVWNETSFAPNYTVSTILQAFEIIMSASPR